MNDTPTPALAEASATLPAARASTPAPFDDPWATAGQPTPATATTAASPAPAAEAASAAADPWGAATTASPDAASSWLSAPATGTTTAPTASAAADTAAAPGGFSLTQWTDNSAAIESGINEALGWFVERFRPFFQTVRAPIDATLGWVEGLLTGAPVLLMVALAALVAWQFAGGAVAVGAVASLLAVVLLGIWPEAMVTLSLVLTSLLFCVVIGLPLGILLAASDRAQSLVRPVLDAMQTTPAFVYLVPVVMLFGIGNVPGVIVTIIFALPPLVRLTNLGIRQVRADLIEAAQAYGASPMQMLLKVQLPLALPSIMAGINQALMLSLSMVVIASMIAVGGLGQMVLRGIGRLDMGLATVGGLGIVLLAITLDRITQSLGQPRRGARHWWHTGPAGLLWRLARRTA
ncbi:MAG: glycine betaine/L-proline ABC transporter permease ProW [Pseudomonadota bacterium]|nr:glycine betaine/L-proline ABC transporter permease ProW [Pseudomonadota bacterium]